MELALVRINGKSITSGIHQKGGEITPLKAGVFNRPTSISADYKSGSAAGVASALYYNVPYNHCEFSCSGTTSPADAIKQ